ncbi:MAG TPA: NAD(P)H-dependent glycerol-3-phosphate dehydrogenase, partial [Paenibacillus sp.]|nr:NAD(P)H-dependent glycerol-3-phosphate dehydrogenase [Paenibacillus sp.]
KLAPNVRATTRIDAAAKHGDLLLFVAPSSAMRDVARQAKPYIRSGQLIVHATKGFEADTLQRMSTVLEEEFAAALEPGSVVVLSGPSHAEEVIQRSPTTVVVACARADRAEAAQDAFITPAFRVYTNPDIAGVELAGALKNIIALGAGMSDGLGFGDNAKAALLTRGLAEIGRLGVAMGANPLTFAGLAGVGDLVVTCTSRHSRNWRAGYKLAEGTPLEEVLDSLGMVVEGVRTTKAAIALADRYGVELPIAAQLHDVLFRGKDPRAAVEALMGRGRTHEIEDIVREAAATFRDPPAE